MVESELVTSRGNRMEPNFEGQNSFLISKRLEGKEREGERERERERERGFHRKLGGRGWIIDSETRGKFPAVV